MVSAVQLQILINAVDKATPALSRVAGAAQDKLGKAVRRGAMVGGAAMAGFAVASIKAAADFDSAMTQSVAIMGDVSDAMRKDMADAAREVAKVTTYSAKEAADAYYFLASAGMDAKQSIEALPVVAQFAQAGMFDLGKATDLLTDAQSALGLASEDTAENMANMTRVGDVLVKMNQKANASVEQFATALTQKGASALKGMNKSLEEGAGMLAFWADQGLKGEQAGNALAGVLQMLPKIAKTNTDAFATYGVEIFDASGKMKSLADIAEEFVPILETMTDAQRAQAFEQMGINRLLADSILKMKGGSEAIREYTAAAYEAAGATQEVAEKQLKTFNAQLALLQSALQDVMIEIGTELLPKLTNLVTVIREGLIPAFQDWWQRHLPEITAGFKAFGEGLRIVSDAFISFGRWIVTNQAALIGAIVAIGVAFAWTNPLLFVLMGATGLIFALGLFGKKSEEVASATEVAFVQMRATVLRVLADIVHGLAQVADAWIAITTLGMSKLAEWAGIVVNAAQGYYNLADAMYADAEASETLVSEWNTLHGELAEQIGLIDLSTTKWRLYGDEVRRAAGTVGLIGPAKPSQIAMRVPVLDPWARQYVKKAQEVGAEAGLGLNAAFWDEVVAGAGEGGAGAAAAEEAMADLGQRLSATFTEELLAGLEGLPPHVMAVISEAGEAIERFSASFRPAIEQVFIDINELAVLGPDVPASYLTAQDAIGRLENQLGYLDAALRIQHGQAATLATDLMLQQQVYDDLTAAVQRYEDRLGAAQDALRRFSSAQLAGTGAYEQQRFNIEQAIARIQLALTEAQLAGASEEEMAGLREQIARLRLEADKLRLEERLEFGAQRRQIEALLKPVEELTYEQIITGIQNAQAEIALAEPTLEYLNELLETQDQRVKDATAAWEDTEETIAANEKLRTDLAGAIATLTGALVSETDAAVKEYQRLIYGTAVVQVYLKGLEKQIVHEFQPALNSIDTSHGVRQLDNLTKAADLAIRTVGKVPGFGSGGGLPGYQGGGIVPGPLGAAQVAIVHGGERISPSGGRRSAGGGITVNNWGRVYNIFRDSDGARRAAKELDRLFREI